MCENTNLRNVTTKEESPVVILPNEQVSKLNNEPESFEAWKARKLRNKSKYI